MTSCPDFTARLVEPDASDFIMLGSAFETELEERYPGIGDDESLSTSDLLVAVVAYRDQVPVGCVGLRELEPGIGEVKRMFVVPEARGLGVARRMLELLEEQARLLGYSTVRLGTGVRQPEALALYESSGYGRIPLFGDYVEGGELCVCYEKAL